MGKSIKLNENTLSKIITESITEVMNEIKEETKKTVKENKIKITENELHKMIAESTVKVLKEAEMDEGLKDFFNRLGAGAKGAMQGYNAQKALDTDYSTLKGEHDYEDLKHTMTNPLAKMPKTAAEQAEALYAQAREYLIMSNKLKAKANAISKKYGLVKSSAGQRVNANPSTPSTVPSMGAMKTPIMQSALKNRKAITNPGTPLDVQTR